MLFQESSEKFERVAVSFDLEEGKIDCGNWHTCVILSAMSRHTHALEHAKSAIALLEYENS